MPCLWRNSEIDKLKKTIINNTSTRFSYQCRELVEVKV